MIFVGNIHKIDTKRSLVQVDYQDTISDWIPYVNVANSFKRHFIPPRKDEQVILLQCDSGNLQLALGSIFCKPFKEPQGSNTNKEITQYEDGTIMSYDTKNKVLDVSCVGDITINCNGDVNLSCDNTVSISANQINIKANNTNFIGGSITHDGTSIDKTHTHTQTAGNHYGAGAATTPPN